MTDDERFEDTIRLGYRIRERVRALVEEIDALPEEEGPVAPALLAWRVGLLTLAWDVSEAPLTIAAARTEQSRSTRMLTRCLFEYAVRLERYAYDHRQAVSDWVNSQVWLRNIIKSGVDEEDMAKWSEDERKAYERMISVEGKVSHEKIAPILRKLFEGRGCTKQEITKAVDIGQNAYTISSSFIHGSQGAFYDLFRFNDVTEKYETAFRSFRLDPIHVLHEAIFYLIQVIFAESIHRQKDLGADMYQRELELTSGLW